MDSRDLDQQIEQYENTPDGYAHSLRLDLTDIVLRHLVRNMTQARLADKAGIKPQMVTRIVHAASNCTFETAGKILFALGVKAKLVEEQSSVILVEETDMHYIEERNTESQTMEHWRGGQTDEEKECRIHATQ